MLRIFAITENMAPQVLGNVAGESISWYDHFGKQFGFML